MRTAKSILSRDVHNIPDACKDVVEAVKVLNKNIITLIRLAINIRSNQAAIMKHQNVKLMSADDDNNKKKE